MDPLAWLGLRDPDDSNLAAIQRAVREVLPEDEAVVIRYIVIVAILLSKVAYSDGTIAHSERDHLRGLFQHIDRLPPDGIEHVCDTLYQRVPQLTQNELTLCFRELKSLCDGRERQRIVRLLGDLARVDGHIHERELGEIADISTHLGVPEDELDGLLFPSDEGESGASEPPDQPES